MPARSMHFSSTVVPLRNLALALSLVSICLPSAFTQIPSADTTDSPVVALDGQAGGSLHNNRIGAEWKIAEGGHLTSFEIRDEQNTSNAHPLLLLNGPFSIELKDVGVLRASDLVISAPGIVEQLTPNPSASRASDRFPGVTVHYPLTDPAGQFHADWALTLRQARATFAKS